MYDPLMLQAVLGTSRAEFDALVPSLEAVWHQALAGRPNRQRSVGAGAKGKLAGAARKLFFILFYLKVYPTFDVLSLCFDLDRSECCRWVHRLLPVLEQVLGRQLVLPKRKISSLAEFAAAFPGVQEVFVDGMERPIQRPTKPSTNRNHYSGKKKRYTRKAILVADPTRRIGWLTPSKRGARHDQRVADANGVIQAIPESVSVLTDSGFQGIRQPGLCQPRKGSKHHPLSEEDRAWDRLVSSIRVRVEHAIGGLNRFGAVSGIYRNHKSNCDDQFNLLAAGLWTFASPSRPSESTSEVQSEPCQSRIAISQQVYSSSLWRVEHVHSLPFHLDWGEGPRVRCRFTACICPRIHNTT